jgi:hypothetical protein
LLVRQIDLVGRQGTFDRRLGRLAPGLPTSRRSLGITRRKPGFMVGLLAFEAFLGPCFDLGARLGQLCQPLLAAPQLIGDRQGRSARSAASAMASNSATFSCASILPACS